jgi:hypothetical protein
MEKRYEFTLRLTGFGATAHEAWENALDGLMANDHIEMPTPDLEEVVDADAYPQPPKGGD